MRLVLQLRQLILADSNFHRYSDKLVQSAKISLATSRIFKRPRVSLYIPGLLRCQSGTDWMLFLGWAELQVRSIATEDSLPPQERLLIESLIPSFPLLSSHFRIPMKTNVPSLNGAAPVRKKIEFCELFTIADSPQNRLIFRRKSAASSKGSWQAILFPNS